MREFLNIRGNKILSYAPYKEDLPLLIEEAKGMIQSGLPWENIIDMLRKYYGATEEELQYISEQLEVSKESVFMNIDPMMRNKSGEPFNLEPEDTLYPDGLVPVMKSSSFEDAEQDVREVLGLEKPIQICVDFDGTIAEYDRWKGNGIFGNILPNVKEALDTLYNNGVEIIIYTCRGDDELDGIEQYLKTNEVPYHYINVNPSQPDGTSDVKLMADWYIDDKAIHADGNWDEIVGKILNTKRKSSQNKQNEKILFQTRIKWKNGITAFQIRETKGGRYRVIDVCEEQITCPGTSVNEVLRTLEEALYIHKVYVLHWVDAYGGEILEDKQANKLRNKASKVFSGFISPDGMVAKVDFQDHFIWFEDVFLDKRKLPKYSQDRKQFENWKNSYEEINQFPTTPEDLISLGWVRLTNWYGGELSIDVRDLEYSKKVLTYFLLEFNIDKDIKLFIHPIQGKVWDGKVSNFLERYAGKQRQANKFKVPMGLLTLEDITELRKMVGQFPEMAMDADKKKIVITVPNQLKETVEEFLKEKLGEDFEKVGSEELDFEVENPSSGGHGSFWPTTMIDVNPTIKMKPKLRVELPKEEGEENVEWLDKLSCTSRERYKKEGKWK